MTLHSIGMNEIQDVLPARRLGGPAIVGAVFVFIAACLGWLFWARSRAMDRPVPAVVILPFINGSGKFNDQYYSDGLTMELIDSLSKVEKLRVVSWNSAKQFRQKADSSNVDLKDLREKLQAGAVLNGVVQKKGDRLHITAKLVDTNGGETIWSDSYDRPEKDVFYVEEQIAKSIVYSLKVQLRVDPQRILVPPRTESMAAFDSYLKARSNNMFPSDVWTEQAIREDSKYPPPYALRAMNRALSGFYRQVPFSAAAPEVMENARKAIALDSSSGQAHAALGIALGLGDWDWKAAHVELDRAVQWSPGSAEAHIAYVIGYLSPMGQLDAAEYEARKAVEIDPLSFLANYVAGDVLLARGKPQEAVDRFRAAASIFDRLPQMLEGYAIALNAVGRRDEARQQFTKSCEVTGATGCDPGPFGYAVLGFVQSRAMLKKEPKVLPIQEAAVYATLGDVDLAFGALNKAVDQRDPQVVFLQADARFNSLRNDPRYDAILKRLRLRE